MTLAAKLRGAFALFVLLLAAVLAHHLSVTRRAAARAHALTAAAARWRLIAGDHAARLQAMRAAAAKYRVTRDTGYLVRYQTLVRDHDASLRSLERAELAHPERAALDGAAGVWGRLTRSDPGGERTPWPDSMDAATARLAAAARSALDAQLRDASNDARRASATAAAVALFGVLLASALAVLLARSLAAPLERLTTATKAIAGGRFDVRVGAPADRQDEIGHLSRNFDAMAQQLERLDRVKRDFVSNVSHDLKAPLASMQETTSVLLDGLGGPLTERQRRLLQLSADSGRRLGGMISRLLELARLDASPPRADEVFDLVPLARAIVAESAEPRAGRGVRVTLAQTGSPAWLRGDRDAMTRVLDNLIENALRFSPAGACVSVSVETRGEHVLLSVLDEGPGIPEAEQRAVFHRFHQAGAGRAAASRGVGLGLAICAQVVEAHGGRIWAEDNVPRGAALRVLLPRVAPAPLEAVA